MAASRRPRSRNAFFTGDAAPGSTTMAFAPSCSIQMRFSAKAGRAIRSMETSAAIIELGEWLKTPPGRVLLAWEQERIDRAVFDIFGYHALQMGLPSLDGLRANRMPHRWLASPRPVNPELEPIAPASDLGLVTQPLKVPVALH